MEDKTGKTLEATDLGKDFLTEVQQHMEPINVITLNCKLSAQQKAQLSF